MSMCTLAQLADFTDGTLVGADTAFSAVSTDTRSLQPGELFVALRGMRYDALSFIDEALHRGAAAAMVERAAAVALPQLVVNDTRQALADFARAWRRKFDIPLIAITGSNGKTTVKELLAAILRAEFAPAGTTAVLATAGNLNNEIGVPLTLLRLRDTHRAAVIEMGASGPGEIAVLADIAAPDVAVITNAARAHLEGFGSLEGVVTAKGELLDVLSAQGTAVLNYDDAAYAAWRSRAGSCRQISFGMQVGADVCPRDIREVTVAGSPAFSFELQTPAGAIAVNLPLAGRQNVGNALAAAAAALAAGATLEAVQQGLAHSRNVAGRMRSFKSVSGALIFDDSYNANPDSVAAAIQSMQTLPGETWLVLGDMGELGSDALALHRATGELAAAAGVQALLCTGELSRATAEGFGPGAHWFPDAASLEAALMSELQPGRKVLIKASRFMGFDRLVQQIEAAARTATHKEEA